VIHLALNSNFILVIYTYSHCIATSFARRKLLTSLGFKPHEERSEVEEALPVELLYQAKNNLDHESMLETAKGLLTQGELNKALEILLKIVEFMPDNPENLRILGAVLISVQQPRVAEEVLYAAVKLSNWTDIISIANLAEAVRLNDDLDTAIQIAFTGLRILNDSREGNAEASLLRYTIGQIYEGKEDYEKAAEWYLTSALIDSKHIDAWLKASTIHFPQVHRNVSLAINVLSEGINRNSENKRLLYSLGVALHWRGQVDEAMVFYERVLDIDPGQIEARIALTSAYENTGRPNEAIALLEDLLSSQHANMDSCRLYQQHVKMLCDQGSPHNKNKELGREYIKRLAFHRYDVSPSLVLACN
jgi:tetratricopeptide (TPR) repeat protein